MFFGKKSQSATNGAAPAGAETAPAASSPLPAKGAAAKELVGDKKASALSAEDAKKRAAAAKQIAASFGEIVMLLMRSPSEKFHSLQDLEWLVAPALAAGQFALADAQSKETGAVMPVGAILWAMVSADVDKRLSEPTADPVRLAPAEWRSGAIPWIMLRAGDPKIVGGLLEQLTKTVFKTRPAKIRVKGADGKIVVGHLGIANKSSPKVQA